LSRRSGENAKAEILLTSGTKPLLLRNCNIMSQTMVSLPDDENFTWDVLWARKLERQPLSEHQRIDTT
jgi:hypothetical protein